MMGVVLWSEKEVGKAVIWCEDQGKLAYVTGEQAEICAELDLQAGDLVSFSLRMQSRLRFAENLEVVQENGYQGLDKALKHGAENQKASQERVYDKGADVIPFRAKAQPHPYEQPRAARVGA